MTLVWFEGQAGTGKTTQLVRALREQLGRSPLGSEQRILGLTKYHGSRRRMEARFCGTDEVGRLFDCRTIDSFAAELVGRQGGRLRLLHLDPPPGDFAAISSAAAQLLADSIVVAWVTQRYPVVVVDEMQDCKATEVQLLARLEPWTCLLCAADAFQDLSGDAHNEATSWAKTVSQGVTLLEIHRTRSAGLLAAARALREGSGLSSAKASGFDIVKAPKAAMAAAAVSWRINSWMNRGQLAIISPTRPETSPFIRDLLEWLATKQARSSQGPGTAGPYRVTWEMDDHEASRGLESALMIPDDGSAPVNCETACAAARKLRAHDLEEWLSKQRNRTGRSSIPAKEVREAVAQIVRARRVFGRMREPPRLALTTHQAKNREFESVIALWPLRIRSGEEQQRRLLYNAITRAKSRAVIIVEDPKGSRLDAPPFVAGAPCLSR